MPKIVNMNRIMCLLARYAITALKKLKGILSVFFYEIKTQINIKKAVTSCEKFLETDLKRQSVQNLMKENYRFFKMSKNYMYFCENIDS